MTINELTIILVSGAFLKCFIILLHNLEIERFLIDTNSSFEKYKSDVHRFSSDVHQFLSHENVPVIAANM